MVVVAQRSQQRLAKPMPVIFPLHPPAPHAGLDVLRQGENSAQVWHQSIKVVPLLTPEATGIVILYVLVIVALSEEIISLSMLL